MCKQTNIKYLRIGVFVDINQVSFEDNRKNNPLHVCFQCITVNILGG